MSGILEDYKWFHRNAELSYCEHGTCAYIMERLEGFGLRPVVVAGTGVGVVIGEVGLPAVVLRSDMDALPVVEATGLPYSSENQGVMHACGHDMHMAILLDVVRVLSLDPPTDRAVVAIFQPAEEQAPGGARDVLSSGFLQQFDVRAVVGQHVSPELNVGVIGLHSGAFMASCDELKITVVGRGGHAALSPDIIDPVRGAVQLLAQIYELYDRYDSQEIVLRFGMISAPGATNVVPSEVQIHGTLRTFCPETRAEIQAEIQRIISQTATQNSLQITLQQLDGYPVVVNNPELTANIKTLLAPPEFSGTTQQIPRRLSGEDFGRYAQHYPATMLRLGVGMQSGASLHNPAFYPHTDALKIGTESLTLIAKNLQIL